MTLYTNLDAQVLDAARLATVYLCLVCAQRHKKVVFLFTFMELNVFLDELCNFPDMAA